jgi:Tol biopolymer transport system component
MIQDRHSKRWRTRLPFVLLAALLLAAVGIGTASALVWQTETAISDGEELNLGGSLALDSAGHPHVSYTELQEATGDGVVIYAENDGTSWSVKSYLGDDVGYPCLALDSADRPRISYFFLYSFAMEYSSFDGTSWHTEYVSGEDTCQPYSSLALDSAGNPRISYAAWGVGSVPRMMKYVAYDGSAWQTSTVDPTGGGESSLALDGSGVPSIAYSVMDSAGNYVLKYAVLEGTTWTIQTVDTASTGMRQPSLKVDSAGHPRIAYIASSTSGSILKYASYDGTSWKVETVDSVVSAGYSPSLALDAAGSPRISYIDQTSDDLKFAWSDGQTWQIDVVDEGSGGGWTSLALDSAGNPRIAYYGTPNADLKYAWSEITPPAGEQIAFSASPVIEDLSQQEGWRIHVMAPDGSGLTWFGKGAGIDTDHLEPSWSPDGSRIVYHNFDVGNRDSVICVMNADGTGGTSITNLPDPIDLKVGCVEPAWSPQGSLIAYASDDSRDYSPDIGDPVGLDLFVMSPDGTGKTQLTSCVMPGSNEYPAWSPDGSKIAFANDEVGNYEIYVMNADASDRIRVTNNPGKDTKPAWSSEGKIAFVSDRDGNNEIYVINPDGTGETRLTSDPGADDDPAWSPDGSRIAFTRAAPNHLSELYFMDKDGGQQTLLPLGDRALGVRCPAWRPTSMPPANRPPSASVTAVPDRGLAPLTVAFDAAASSDPDGTIASYAWAFGDGSTGTGVTTSHPYASPGTYTATLTVTDNDGGTDTASTTIYALTPAEATSDLRTQVMAYGVRADVQKGLTDKLDIVTAALTQGNDKMAVNNLNAFIKLVKAQKGKALTAAQADALIAEARKIIANIQL